MIKIITKWLCGVVENSRKMYYYITMNLLLFGGESGVNNTYITEHEIKFSEIDCSYKMRPDHIVNCLQDVTGLHSKEMGIDGQALREKSNAFWVLTRLILRFHRSPQNGERLTLETWPTTVKGVRFGRDFRVSKGGDTLISCSSEWCTLDCDTLKPRRADTVAYPHDMPHREDRCDAGEFLRARETVGEDDLNHFHRSSFVDIDTNRHTNNVAYLRMMLNCFSPQEFEAMDIDRLQIAFLSQTYFGDQIAVYKKKTDYGFYIEGRAGDTAVFNVLILLK